LPRKYRYPHHGGVVSRELSARGLGVENKRATKWMRQNWHSLIVRLDTNADWAKPSEIPPPEVHEIADGVKIANQLPLDLG
jgi:hypothetical protein